MASITNRSNYLVSVEGAPEHTRRFSFSKIKEAKSYLREQRALQKRNGQAPESAQLRQLEDQLLVRIRHKGHPLHTARVGSYEEAESEVLRVLADRAQGRRIDYNRACTITLAQLFDRYIEEECPRHKGCAIETYTLNSFLTDIGHESAYARRTRHQLRKNVEWLERPFADVQPADFQRYADSRVKQGAFPRPPLIENLISSAML